MALIKKAGPQSLPLTSADYVAQNLLQTQDKLDLENPIRISGSNVLKGALFQVGETYYYGESVTAITGTPSDYVKITPSVDTLTATASFVANLTGVTWNDSYNGYYDVSGNAYIFDEAKALQATAISTIMTRYVKQDSSGDVVIGRDLEVGRDLTVGDNITVSDTGTIKNFEIEGQEYDGSSTGLSYPFKILTIPSPTTYNSAFDKIISFVGYTPSNLDKFLWEGRIYISGFKEFNSVIYSTTGTGEFRFYWNGGLAGTIANGSSTDGGDGYIFMKFT